MKSSRAIKKGEEGENLIAEILDKDTSYHRLINNLVLLGDNGVSHQIDHILIRSNGVFVIETKNYYGLISGKEDDSFWTRSYFVKGKVKKATFHNPLKQNQSHIRAIKKIIGKDYPIYCFVVFVQNNSVSLDFFNACDARNLLQRINLLTSEKELSNGEIEAINGLLLAKEAYLNTESHVNNIKNAEKSRKAAQKEIRAAIEKKICPKCGSSLVLSNNELKCLKCSYKIKF
ncbi:MAG: NERD domain-containing protein [Bacilli bacterium]|nr:NERD domain-containing protein [Bacilli bacterium]